MQRWGRTSRVVAAWAALGVVVSANVERLSQALRIPPVTLLVAVSIVYAALIAVWATAIRR